MTCRSGGSPIRNKVVAVLSIGFLLILFSLFVNEVAKSKNGKEEYVELVNEQFEDEEIEEVLNN